MTTEWTAQIYHDGSAGRAETFLHFTLGERERPDQTVIDEAEKAGLSNIRVGYVIRGHHVPGSPGVCRCHEGLDGCTPQPLRKEGAK